MSDAPRDIARISLLLAIISWLLWPVFFGLSCLAFPFSIALLLLWPLCWLGMLGTGLAAMTVGDRAMQQKRGSRGLAKAGSLLGFANCMVVLLLLLCFALGR